MNFKRKIKTILITVGIFCALSIIINTKFSYFQGNNSENLEGENEVKLKRAGYWIFTETAIYIDDDSMVYNWAITAATNDWCSGSGTQSDPYIIENIIIKGGGGPYSDLILIENSDVYFVIRNCTVYDEDRGITLKYVNNGKLINNNCSFNEYYGIGLLYSAYNVITANTVNNNYLTGISLRYSDNNEILSNSANNNSVNYGISLGDYSDDNIVYGNTVNFNEEGILISWYSDNNTVSGNIINYNDYGTYLSTNCGNNIIIGNIITNNHLYGILLKENSYSNIIYNNTFLDNTLNAYDNGDNNRWDNGIIGNYWDDYSGPDANDDGIGDKPYDLPPVGGSRDDFPIYEDGNDIGPTIIINSPEMNQIFGLNAPHFNITVFELYSLNTTWYTIDEGATNYTIFEFSGLINQTAWDKKESGTIIIKFYANDSMGYIGFNEIYIQKDIGGIIPSYHVFLLLSIICIISVILVKKQINSQKRNRR